MSEPAAEFPGEVVHRTARTSEWRGASQVPATALAQITDGFVRKSVQMSGSDILLKLFIPNCGVELREPVAESQKLPARKLADRCFDLVNGTHVPSINHLGFQSKTITQNRRIFGKKFLDSDSLTRRLSASKLSPG